MSNEFKISKKQAFLEGFRDGLPIGLGYLAVSFSLGILAKNADFNPFQGFLVSLLNNASAGEYAIFTLVAAGATYAEVALMTLVANARYLLMSTALSQRVDPDMPFIHRFFVAFDITDEIFAISINRPGFLNPFYNYGAFSVALPGWAIGTSLGIIAGNLMPQSLVSAFSVALYGMFLACIIPAAKKDKTVAVLIIIAFLLSYITSTVNILKTISDGTRTIILTILIAGLAAIIKPHDEVNISES
mgnify:CR=1 FL=1